MTDPVEEPRWLTPVQVRLLHAEALRLFGGTSGLRDKNLLESALARLRQLFAYGENPDLFDLAAAYVSGLARNRPFVDGNKRVALLAVRAFLSLNGFAFEADQVETVTVFEDLAAGRIEQEWLAGWIRESTSPRR